MLSSKQIIEILIDNKNPNKKANFLVLIYSKVILQVFFAWTILTEPLKLSKEGGTVIGQVVNSMISGARQFIPSLCICYIILA